MGRQTDWMDRIKLIPREPTIFVCIRCNFRYVDPHGIAGDTYFNRKKRDGFYGPYYKGAGSVCRDRRKCNRHRRKNR